ncbi:hypothetical protein, partial [Mesorhizobium sp. M7A.F.Ca.CA.004.11.1.1]|uniref:hypothetical protein n=1 Tax=Mesorhizobium sp. M7A.F.Ca.CA.004.11.1.1 TaxID=2496698 RepID=UPI000FD61166
MLLIEIYLLHHSFASPKALLNISSFASPKALLNISSFAVVSTHNRNSRNAGMEAPEEQYPHQDLNRHETDEWLPCLRKNVLQGIPVRIDPYHAAEDDPEEEPHTLTFERSMVQRHQRSAIDQPK